MRRLAKLFSPLTLAICALIVMLAIAWIQDRPRPLAMAKQVIAAYVRLVPASKSPYDDPDSVPASISLYRSYVDAESFDEKLKRRAAFRATLRREDTERFITYFAFEVDQFYASGREQAASLAKNLSVLKSVYDSQVVVGGTLEDIRGIHAVRIEILGQGLGSFKHALLTALLGGIVILCILCFVFVRVDRSPETRRWIPGVEVAAAMFLTLTCAYLVVQTRSWSLLFLLLVGGIAAFTIAFAMLAFRPWMRPASND